MIGFITQKGRPYDWKTGAGTVQVTLPQPPLAGHHHHHVTH
jgi:hypothetical protein